MSDKKSNVDLNTNLEAAFNSSENDRNFLRTVLDAQLSMIVVIRNGVMVDVNKAFLNFFDTPSLEYFLKNVTKSLGSQFEQKPSHSYLRSYRDGMNWIEYVLHYNDEQHKVLMRKHVFQLSVVKIINNEQTMYIVTFNDITELERAKISIEDSIEYASLIQHSLVPQNELFRKYADDFFVIWHPKNVVGGDIYLLEELRNNNDEMLLMVIDCTGHGIPGAFVTMLVKAIEKQIVGEINYSDDDVNPAKILSIFNRTMKNLLKQESKDSISNAGFDGGILYYNRLKNQIVYAGAKTPLYVAQGKKVEIYQGDKHSIGYKRSNPDYEFTNHVIDIKEETVIYLATDGFIDQAGGEEGLPFGKGRFSALIDEFCCESLADQQELFLDALLEYQDERKANDDITLVSLKFLRYNYIS